MASGPDQSIDQVCLIVIMEAHLLIAPIIFGGINCTIRIFQLFRVWMMHGHTPQNIVLP